MTKTGKEKGSGRNPQTGSRRKSQVGSTRTGRIMLFILLGLAVIISVFMVLAKPIIIEKSQEECNIKIPAGATEAMVRDTLEKYFGKGYTKSILDMAKLRGVDISKRHGAYTIPANTNALSAMRKLTSGAQTPVRITINGFRSLPLLIDRVSRKMEFPADSLAAALNDPELMSKYGLTPESALALFIDDTYEVYWTASARELVEKIGDNYLYLWERCHEKEAAALGMTPADIMIIASIVDEETNLKYEKGVVGRLYINRLHKGMKLQADPTVRFAMGDFTVHRITNADLKTESPYNTYLHAGLPPGPIRTTSYETVKAILTSTPHDYLFMCANDDFQGGHNFAVTYEEHLKNAEKYQAALDAKGITR